MKVMNERTMTGTCGRRLTTGRLLLRCPKMRDAPALRAAVGESLTRLKPWFAWAQAGGLSTAESRATVRVARWYFLAGRELQFYVFLRQTGQLIGICGLCNPDWTQLAFEIRYWLRSGYEGRGYAGEAVAALVDFAFESLGAGRLEIRCHPANGPSIALARRLGFTYEPLQRCAGDPDELLFVMTAPWQDNQAIGLEAKSRSRAGGLHV